MNNDLSNSYLCKQFSRNADLGQGVLIKLLENCPELSPEWLLTGASNMLKTKVVEVERVNEIDYEKIYFDVKHTIEIQKKYIYGLWMQIENKRNAG